MRARPLKYTPFEQKRKEGRHFLFSFSPLSTDVYEYESNNLMLFNFKLYSKNNFPEEQNMCYTSTDFLFFLRYFMLALCQISTQEIDEEKRIC